MLSAEYRYRLILWVAVLVKGSRRSSTRASRDEAFDMDGMGVLVIKKRAKEFFYRRYQGFNTLIIKI